MTQVNTVDLTRLRTRPHQARLWLSIYQPKTRFSASFASGVNDNTKIYYNSVTTGSYLQIQPNSTVLLGTVAGSNDMGQLRVKSASGTYLDMAMNNDVDWSKVKYLTVLDLHEALPRYMKSNNTMIDNEDDLAIWMDGNIEYTDQNTVLGTQVCMGGNYAGFSENPVFYSSSGTFNVKGETLNYEWWFEGGTPTGSTSAHPGNVSYSSPGNYITRLKVSNPSGTAIDYGYRHISIYNHSDRQPIRNWGMDNLAGSREEGGYTSSIWVREILPNLLEGSIVVIFADEEYYGGEKVSLGGNSPNRSNILFSGYIDKNSIVYDWRDSTTKFDVSSITGILKEREGTSLSIDDVKTSHKWYQIPNLSVRKVLWAYSKWHTTIGEVADIRYIGEDSNLEFYEFSITSMYDTLNDYLKNKMYGQMVSDRQGTIFIEPGIEMTHNATGVYPVNMELLRQDWVGEVSLDKKVLDTVSYLEIAGGLYDGKSTGTYNTSKPIMSMSPGNVRGYAGKSEIGEVGLITTSQSDLNQKCGHVFAYMNSDYPQVEAQLAGNYKNFDLAPLEQVLLTINREDTNSGIIFTRKPFHIMGIEWNYEPDNASLRPTLMLHDIPDIAMSQTLPVPETPDENYSSIPDLIDYNFPGFCSDILSDQPNTVITEPELIVCAGDIHGEENGFWDTGIKGITLESNYPVTFRIPYNFWYRGSSYDHQTTYTINGQWLKRSVTSIPAGQWENDLDDTWYDLYLCDPFGNRIGQAIKDPVSGNGYVRTGKFNVAQGVQIDSIELVLTPDTNPITSVDWTPFTIAASHTMKTKIDGGGGVIVEDAVQRIYSAGIYSGFENGSVWTPRAGAGYPYNKLFDVTFTSYGLGRITGIYPPDISRWNRYRIGVGTNTDYVTLVDLNTPLDDYLNSSYARADLDTYTSEWLPTSPSNNYLTVRTGFVHTGGAWNADVITGTLLSIRAKSAHKLLLNGFFLWNICEGMHA